jgi:hypothetical protein
MTPDKPIVQPPENPATSSDAGIQGVVDAIHEQTRLARRTKRRFIIAACVIAYILFAAYNEGCDRAKTICRPTITGSSVCEQQPPG